MKGCRGGKSPAISMKMWRLRVVLRSISCIDARRLPAIDSGLVVAVADIPAPTPPLDAVALALEDLDRVFDISRTVAVSTGTIASGRYSSVPRPAREGRGQCPSVADGKP